MLRKKAGALIQTSSREQLANQIRKISVLAVLRMEWGGGTGEERGWGPQPTEEGQELNLAMSGLPPTWALQPPAVCPKVRW